MGIDAFLTLALERFGAWESRREGGTKQVSRRGRARPHESGDCGVFRPRPRISAVAQAGHSIGASAPVCPLSALAPRAGRH